MPNVKYECSLCHVSYDTENAAANCEKKHMLPTGIACSRFYNHGMQLPQDIDVRFADGRTATYELKR